MKICFNRVFCKPFEFGIPLEDLFPPNDIHPQFKDLLELTYSSCCKSSMSLSDILKYQGTTKDRLNLKEKFLNGVKIRSWDYLPGSYLWLIRHFLGLVPVSVFPKYTNGTFYDWEKLAVKCKFYLYNRNYNVLDAEISKNISGLPAPNILLVQFFLHFLRRIMLIYNTSFQEKPDVKNVMLFTKFFSSSLFLRPYRPGFSSRVDKLYYPLSFYIISKWPKLEFTYRYFLKEKKFFLIYGEFHKRCETGCQTMVEDNTALMKDLNCCCKIGSNYESKLLNSNRDSIASSSSLSSLDIDDDEKHAEFFEPEIESTKIELTEAHFCDDGDGFVYDDYDTFTSEAFNQVQDQKSDTTASLNHEEITYESLISDAVPIQAKKSTDNSLGRKISSTNKYLVRFITRAKSKLRKSQSAKSLVSTNDLISDNVHLNKTSLSRSVSRFRNSANNIKYKKLLTL